MKAGFIGLGDMGAGIARRLARSGFAITGCDVAPAVLAAFDEPGTTRTAEPLEAARGAAMLGICVRTDTQLESLAGDGRLFAAMAPGGLVMLHSTISPELARSLAERARSAEIGFVDVGVSGGSKAALAGSLALFVGGEPADIARARPWLDAIGTTFALGPVGRGQEGKLLNNLISIANYGTSLAILDLGASLGFDRAQLVAAFQAGSGQSFALNVAPGMIETQGADPSAAAARMTDLHELLLKDVRHGAELDTEAPRARATILGACDALLARLRGAAADLRGDPAPRDAQTVADAYFAAVLARDIDSLMSLFDVEATVDFLDGTRVAGRAAINTLYRGAYAQGWPTPTPGARYTAPGQVAVEVAAVTAAGAQVRTCNVFTSNAAGMIQALTIYARPSCVS
jgi:3-hydroxyisobutyrate dehydrogenase-like beta-hydroxyacid dehydrogenase